MESTYFCSLVRITSSNGEMPEWSNGTVSKTVDLGNWVRGFESLSLRRCSLNFRFLEQRRASFFFPSTFSIFLRELLKLILIKQSALK